MKDDIVADLRAGVERALALGAVAVWAVVQCGLAVAQRIHGGAIGLGRLGESPYPYVHFGPAVATQGTMVHPYLLAGLAMLAASLIVWAVVTHRHPIWIVLGAVAVAPVGFTYSRAGLLGFALLGGCVGLAALLRGGRHWLAVGALVVGAAVPALIWSNGWTQRAQQTTSGAAVNSIDTDRSTLIKQALHLIKREPVLGVGPGRYVIELRDRHMAKIAGVYKPVHDLPLLVAAEGGVLAGALMVALLGATGWQARRAGWLGLAVFLNFLPWVLLDHFPYTFPQGLAMTGVWIGALDLLARRTVAVSPPAAAPA